MKNKAVEKINAELGKNPDGYMLWIADYLKKINNSDKVSEKILDPKKNIKNCFDELKKVARKKQKNSCYYMSDEEKETLIKQYYGIENIAENKESDSISLFDLI